MVAATKGAKLHDKSENAPDFPVHYCSAALVVTTQLTKQSQQLALNHF